MAFDDSICSNGMSGSATLTVLIIFSICGVSSFFCLSFCLAACQGPKLRPTSAHFVPPPEPLTPRSFWIIQDEGSMKSIVEYRDIEIQSEIGGSDTNKPKEKKLEFVVALPVS